MTTYTQTLEIDVNRDEIPTGVLDFTGLRNGPALVIRNAPDRESASEQDLVYQARVHRLKNIRLIGPGRHHRDTTGILFENAAGVGADDCIISGFGRGIEFGSHTWGNMFKNINVYRCHEAVNVQHSTNSGEIISFFSSAFFNSIHAIRTVSHAHLGFFGSAFDYCYDASFIVDGNSNIELHSCHIEMDQLVQRDAHPVYLAGGWNNFNMFGGMIYMKPTDEQFTPRSFFRNNAQVYLNNVRMHRILGDYLQSGSGNIRTEGLIQHNMSAKPKKEWYSWIPFV